MPSSLKGSLGIEWKLKALILATLIVWISSAPTKTAIIASPQSRNLTLDTDVIILTCNATAEGIRYSVNGINADHNSIKDKGFHQENVKTVATGVVERMLTARVSPSINNSIIVCRAFTIISSISEDISDPAVIQVQGPLAKPSDLTHELVEEDHYIYVDITWTPPSTLMGTTILGYNITVGGQYSMFTEDTHARVNLSEINLCEPVNINISAYNGVNGESLELQIIVPTVPDEDINIPVKTDESYQKEKLFLSCNVSKLCDGQKPTNIMVTVVDKDNNANHKDYYYSLQRSDSSNEILVSNDTIPLDEDNKEYHIDVTFRNNGGWFKNITTIVCMNNLCKDQPTTRTEMSTNGTTPTTSEPELTSNAIQAEATKYLVLFAMVVLNWFL